MQGLSATRPGQDYESPRPIRTRERYSLFLFARFYFCLIPGQDHERQMNVTEQKATTEVPSGHISPTIT